MHSCSSYFYYASHNWSGFNWYQTFHFLVLSRMIYKGKHTFCKPDALTSCPPGLYDALIYLALRLFKLSEPWLKMMSGNNDNFDLSKGMAWPEIVATNILVNVINCSSKHWHYNPSLYHNQIFLHACFPHYHQHRRRHFQTPLTGSYIEKAYAGWWPTHSTTLPTTCWLAS